jgi:UTP--glucose-1-phosphate uridylyltransferase
MTGSTEFFVSFIIFLLSSFFCLLSSSFVTFSFSREVNMSKTCLPLVMCTIAAAAAQEFGGLYHVTDDIYALALAKVSTSQASFSNPNPEKAYAEGHLKLAVVPVADDQEATLHAAEVEGAHALASACVEVDGGGLIAVAEDACVELHLDTQLFQTVFKIDTTSHEFVAIFAEHDLAEFGTEAARLLSDDGRKWSPEHVLDDSHDEDGHADEDANFEFGGLYHVTTNEIYELTLSKTNGAYAETTMTLAVLPVADDEEATLHAAEEEGNHALEAACVEVDGGGLIAVAEDACVELHVDETKDQTVFQIDVASNEFIVLFAEHDLAEFGPEAAHLVDEEGHEASPEHLLSESVDGDDHSSHDHGGGDEDADDDEDKKPWGKAILASLLVMSATFSGIVLLVPVVKKIRSKNESVFNCVVYSFAAGAILSTAFFFILFESTHLVAAGWDSEVDVTWRWGSAVLGGFLLPQVSELLIMFVLNPEERCHPGPNVSQGTDSEMGGVEMVAKSAEAGDQEADLSQFAADTQPKGLQAYNLRAWAGVLLGDFMHNFIDGVLIASAFSLCGDSAGWSLAAASIGHEIAQEIGDFCVLTGAAGVPIKSALITNFLSGTSVLFGAITVLSQDVNNESRGLILAFGGGVYIAIAATECMPRVNELATTNVARVAAILAFCVGATAIGLVLLDHEHCYPEGGGGGHEGHNH